MLALFGVGGVIALMVLVVGWGFWLSLGTKSGSATYVAGIRLARQKKYSPEEAVLFALKPLLGRVPFNALTNDDQIFLAKLFGKLQRPELLAEFIESADKERSVERIRDRAYMVGYAKRIQEVQIKAERAVSYGEAERIPKDDADKRVKRAEHAGLLTGIMLMLVLVVGPLLAFNISLRDERDERIRCSDVPASTQQYLDDIGMLPPGCA